MNKSKNVQTTFKKIKLILFFIFEVLTVFFGHFLKIKLIFLNFFFFSVWYC